jgi:hypothetical protein
MDFQDLFQKYGPIAALGLWFAYKWWNSRRVIALLRQRNTKRHGKTVVIKKQEIPEGS